jgi:hypothetical protein
MLYALDADDLPFNSLILDIYIAFSCFSYRQNHPGHLSHIFIADMRICRIEPGKWEACVLGAPVHIALKDLEHLINLGNTDLDIESRFEPRI